MVGFVLNCGECKHIYITKYNNYACAKIGGAVISPDNPVCRDNFEVKRNDRKLPIPKYKNNPPLGM